MTSDNLPSDLISFNDVKYWIYDCNRYLFLSKVHLENSDVQPEIDGDPIKYIESMGLIFKKNDLSQDKDNFQNKFLIQKTGEEPIIIQKSESFFDFHFNSDDLLDLKNIFSEISSGRWEDINIARIEHSQDILYNLLLSVKGIFKSI